MGNAVPRVMFAWELGGGQGHVRAFLPVAERLRDAGVDVVCAVRDLVAGKPFFDAGFKTFPAPRVLYQLMRGLEAFSYAEILLRAGYGKPENVDAVLGAWTTLFRLTGTDLVVSDFAPGALLAARVAGLKAATIGIGFPTPPMMSPLPSFRPRNAPPVKRMQQSEQAVLASVNAALTGRCGTSLKIVAELCHTGCDLLAAFPELEQYPQRRDGRYVGPIFSTPKNAAVVWPNAPGPRVFAYLEGPQPEFPDIIAQLRATGWPTFVVGRVMSPEDAARLSTPTLTVSAANADLNDVLKTAQVVVCHGNYGLVCQSLLAGVPVVGVPTHPENELTTDIVERLRFGRLVPLNSPAPALTRALEKLVADDAVKQAVNTFATRHRGYDPASAVAAAATALLERMRP